MITQIMFLSKLSIMAYEDINMKLKIPKNETLWVTHTLNGIEKYVITSNKERSTYFLYEVNSDGTLNKICKGNAPTDFDKKIKL